MIKTWSDQAWEDYLYWQKECSKTLKKINKLIKDIDRNGYEGIGDPEPLKGDLAGWWSRRINRFDRIVYRINGGAIEIAQCRSHYGSKDSAINWSPDKNVS